MKDVIIVGSGISGCTLAWTWLLRGHSVNMISSGVSASSSVAAGVFNPLVLKRFTPIWNAQAQLDVMLPFYKDVENALGQSVLKHIPVLRRLHDNREAGTWTRKAHREDLKDFMIPEVRVENVPEIHAPYGYGRVVPTGWCDTTTFISATTAYLMQQESFIEESFDHDLLIVNNDDVSYKNVKARYIIFAEGYAMRANTYYKHLPLQGNKGELLIVRIPNFTLDYIIKSSVFLMHYKDDLFWVGATYNNEELTMDPTHDAREYLTSRLALFLTRPYEIVHHKVGIRPTTQDRRPFIGTTDSFKRHFIFNGMGSRAVLLAPWCAVQLYDHIVHEKPLDAAIDCNRFRTSTPC